MTSGKQKQKGLQYVLCSQSFQVKGLSINDFTDSGGERVKDFVMKVLRP